MKKILITGINGFIGSNCKEYFKNKGYDIFGIDLSGQEEKNVLIGEVDEPNLVSFNAQFDYIIHLAGSATVSMAQNAPEIEKTKSVNSTKQLLEYIKKYNKNARLIFSSSAAVYGNDYNRPISENDKLNPISVYGLHKLESENLCEFYANNFDLDIKIVRIFSLYGNGLKKQLLWDFSNRAINAQKDLICFGSGQEQRDFIHISDLLNFFEILLMQDKFFDYYNCAYGSSLTVRDIMENILREMNLDLKLNFDNIKREGNPQILIANIEKARKIGFNPKINFEKGIKDYVKWFKKNN